MDIQSQNVPVLSHKVSKNHNKNDESNHFHYLWGQNDFWNENAVLVDLAPQVGIIKTLFLFCVIIAVDRAKNNLVAHLIEQVFNPHSFDYPHEL